MAIAGLSSKLTFFRSGDEGWTTVEDSREGYQYITYYQGKFHAINYEGIVVACEMSPLPRVIEITPPVHAREDDLLINYFYLVESSGELLKVIRQTATDSEESSDYYTVGFEVLKLDQSTGMWTEVNSLGDRTIFLDDYGSITLSAEDCPECRQNCIYFTNGEEYDDMGIFNLGDGSIEFTEPFPAIWVTPNPW